MSLLTSRNRLMDSQNKIMVAGGKDGIVRKFGKDMDTLLYLKRITSNDLQHMKPCSVLSGAWMEGSLRKGEQKQQGRNRWTRVLFPQASTSVSHTGTKWNGMTFAPRQRVAWQHGIPLTDAGPAPSLTSFYPTIPLCPDTAIIP